VSEYDCSACVILSWRAGESFDETATPSLGIGSLRAKTTTFWPTSGVSFFTSVRVPEAEADLGVALVDGHHRGVVGGDRIFWNPLSISMPFSLRASIG
jgi:hypothetical protein